MTAATYTVKSLEKEAAIVFIMMHLVKECAGSSLLCYDLASTHFWFCLWPPWSPCCKQ